MANNINATALRQIQSHYNRFGLKYWMKGLPYERCAELSWIVDYLSPQFSDDLRYLDIGTGESPLPTFLLAHTAWQITCLDKCSWVLKQHNFCDAIDRSADTRARFRVVRADLRDNNFPENHFDIITCISVIEHFAGDSDSLAMKAAARLLRPGGRMILTTPVNHPYFAEFYLAKTVYGDRFRGEPVFYQRHYDLEGVRKRLTEPSGLEEKYRTYFGDYGFQCFEKVLQRPKALRVAYAWSTPRLARRYLSYRPHPVGRKDMRMNTASGVILVLEKPSSAQSCA